MHPTPKRETSSMSLDAARKAHAIFTAAIEQPKPERESLITARCEGDSALES